MSSKLALVVDDSRMARYVLSKMLSEQGINVDSVESGEEALGYLCDKKPSMIFMDHTMPGMDGFQCLRAIKNDPHTAMIPIIMYTSKEGEVYESQARALGAADVLPKTLKPLTLARVLEEQNLLPGQSAPNSSPANDVVIVDDEPDFEPEPIPTAADSDASAESKADNSELIALEKRVESLTEQLSSIGAQEPPPKREQPWLLYGGIGFAVILIAWLALKNNQLSKEVNTLQVGRMIEPEETRFQNSQNTSLDRESEREEAPEPEAEAIATETEAAESTGESIRQNRRFYESIEWALNEDGQFPWDEKPFGDRLAKTLTKLADNLASVDFVGEINIKSHLGRFCLETLPTTGEPTLPDDGSTLGDCEILRFNDDLAETIGTLQSQGFERFLSAFEAEYGDKVELTLSTAADSKPISRYPRPDSDMAAEKWNKIAARNQRIEISIEPY